MMTLKKPFLIIELFLILVYLIFISFSIVIQPINIILGIICVLFLPGYNFLKIIKPNYNLSEKLGYMIILSLAIENIFMFFSYIFLYNFITWPDFPGRPYIGMVFDPILLIIAFQSINIILILIHELKPLKKKENEDSNNISNRYFHRGSNDDIFQYKLLIIFIGFIVSLILLSITTIFSNITDNSYKVNYVDYRLDFTFFIRVPLIFYLFLGLSILCLTYIIFYSKNYIIILSSISMFIYCLWILPYLQIGNYFSLDSYYLYGLYDHYLTRGITAQRTFGFCLIPKYGTQRYSTNLFTAIIITSATNVDITFALWYLFPLIFIFTPFLFYSIFKNFSNRMDKENLNLILLSLFVILTPQIIKGGHNASTGLLGIIIFFILVIEFYKLLHVDNFKINNLIFIILFYFFLCLTHFEECIYFILLIAFYSPYYFFIKIQEFKIENEDTKELMNPIKREQFSIFMNIKNDLFYKKLKKKNYMIGFLILTLFFIFYIIQEFFGWIRHIFGNAFSYNAFFYFFWDIYIKTKFKLPFILRGTENFSFFIIIIIILGTLLFVSLIQVLLFKNFNIILTFYNFGLKIIKKIHNLICKVFTSKIFQILFFPLSFSTIIIIDLLFVSTLESITIFSIIGLILSSAFSIFHIFLFIMGIIFYNIKNDKQNYFLLSIILSSIIIIFLAITGIMWGAIYLIQAKFITYLGFFNLILIQNTFFRKFQNKKKVNLIYLIILLLFLGVFNSLRTLAYG